MECWTIGIKGYGVIECELGRGSVLLPWPPPRSAPCRPFSSSQIFWDQAHLQSYSFWYVTLTSLFFFPYMLCTIKGQVRSSLPPAARTSAWSPAFTHQDLLSLQGFCFCCQWQGHMYAEVPCLPLQCACQGYCQGSAWNVLQGNL